MLQQESVRFFPGFDLRHYILFIFFFFFQAEDGIRDPLVTGVQTCALPIFHVSGRNSTFSRSSFSSEYERRASEPFHSTVISSTRACSSISEFERRLTTRNRSEERRVGKECRSRWAPDS